MTEKIELPPLPEPALILPEAVPSSGAFMMWKPSHRFTAEQMRSYASEAVRMAVEAERNRALRACQKAKEDLLSVKWPGEIERAGTLMADAIAAAIRQKEE